MATDRTGTFYAAEGSVHGYGVQFLVGESDASPETFEAVAGVRSVTFGDTDTEDIDVTHLRSLARHREHRPGMRDSSPIVVNGIFLPDEQSLSRTGGGTGPFSAGGLPVLAESETVRNFRVRHADFNQDYEVRGYVKKFALQEANQDGVIEYVLEVMPTQAPAYVTHA